MPKVIFEENSLTVDVPEGGALADVCDKHDSPIPFSCRSANCGTCRVEVLEGQSLLTEPGDEELDILDVFGLKAPKFRLACQAQLVAGPGTVKVRAVDPDVE